MLQDITLGQFFPGNSIIHKLDPRTKILLLVVFMILIFAADGAAAYALQSGQPENIWGQAIGTDTAPVFTTDAAKKVYKVEFKKKDDAGFTNAAADMYVNNTGVAELPSFTSGDEK